MPTIALPGIDQFGPRCLARLSDVDKTIRGVAPDRIACPARRKLAGRFALPFDILPADRRDLDGTVPLGRGAECRARLNCLQLLGIADENNFRPLLLRFRHDALKLAGTDHPGLVDHKDMLVGQPFTIIGPLMFERSEEHTSELQSLMRISYA